MSSKITYRQQFTRCGKQRCRKCKEGASHGPYWYAYWSENGRTISKYVGIHLPDDVVVAADGAHLQQGLPILGKAEDVAHESAIDPARATQASSPRIPITPAPTGRGGIDPARATQASSPRIPITPAPTGRSASYEVIDAPGTYPLLRIFLLGQFRIERRDGNEWQTIVNRTWKRRRARALLGCLLSTPGRRLGREQAMEALWPDVDTETAANRLNGAVHELRRLLEPEIARPAESSLLRLERDVLILAGAGQIWVDAEAFEAFLNKANTSSNPEQVEQFLEEAAALYGGDYLLEELYSEWTAARREALRRGWIGLLLNLAEMRATRGALTSAIEPLDRLLATDPTHETAVRRLMILLTQLDRRGEALRIYHRLASILQRDYGTDPLPETRELHEALRQGLVQIPSPGTSPVPKSARQSGRYNQSPLVGREKELDTMRQLMLAIERADKSTQSPINRPLRHSAQGSLTRKDGEAEDRQPEGPARVQSKTYDDGVQLQMGLQDWDFHRHFLLLTGESGIGKTRLAEELSQEASARGWTVAWSRAYEQECTIPYRPWTELLRTLLQHAPNEFLLSSLEIQFIAVTEEKGQQGNERPATISTSAESLIGRPNNRLERLSALLPELSAQAASLQHRSSPLPFEMERLHLWEATSGLLSALSRINPLLLVLDDLHWTDDSSLELLAYLARHIQDERILLVGTYRDTELAPTSNVRTLISDLLREQAIVTLPVQHLTQYQIGSLLAHLPQDIVQSIQTQAGGNPFFAEELARYSGNDPGTAPVALSGVANDDIQAAVTRSMPDTIAAVLDRRLSRLSNDCQTLLGKAAVLGGSFELDQLLLMAGDPESGEDTILDLLEEALRAGLLVEEGTGAHITYHFWHPLIVSHLYERLSAARRAQLHRRTANALQHLHVGHEAEVADAITHHLSKGGSDPLQIARYAEIAGNRAYSLSAYPEAQHYYRQTIKALMDESMSMASTSGQDPLHLACLLERIAECCMYQGNFEEVRHFYERALALRNQQRQDAGETGSSRPYREQEAQRQALIWREIGRAWAYTSEYDHARQCYTHGKQVLSEAGVTAGAAWACLHLEHGNICRLKGNYDEARRYVQEALEMLEQAVQDQSQQTTTAELETRTTRAMIGDPLVLGRAHEILGVIAAIVGQYSEALQRLNNALAIFEQHDLVMAMSQVYGNLGAVHAMKAEIAVARTYFQRSLDLSERMGDLPNMAFVTGNLGDAAARSGDLLEAEEWFKRSLALAERINDREHMSWCNVALGTSLQDQGNLRGALESIRRAITLGRKIKSTHCISFALVALGDLRVTQAIAVYNTEAMHTAPAEEDTTDPFTGRFFGKSSSQPGRGTSPRARQASPPHINPTPAPTGQVSNRLLSGARAAVQRALALEGWDAEVMTEGHLVLASIYFLLGDLETAEQKALQAMEETGQHEIVRVLARTHRLLGRIKEAQGQLEEADSHFEQALTIFRNNEMRLDYARALHGYGATLVQRSIHSSMGTINRPTTRRSIGDTTIATLPSGREIYQKGLAFLNEARDIFNASKATIDLEWVEQLIEASTSHKELQLEGKL